MGRKKSEFICPKCGKHGFKRKNPIGVVHYDHATRQRKTCYHKSLYPLSEQKDHENAEGPPEKFWGESSLYYKLGNLANHFHRIGNYLEEIQTRVYRLKPDENISAQCVEDLDLFEKKFLNPVERLLIPYHDRRWGTNWNTWFKIQMDSYIHGPRASGLMNGIPTGEFIYELSKDGKTVYKIGIKRPFTSSQVKKRESQVIKFAYELLESNPLNRALNSFVNNTYLSEGPKRSPEEFLEEEMKKQSKRNR